MKSKGLSLTPGDTGDDVVTRRAEDDETLYLPTGTQQVSCTHYLYNTNVFYLAPNTLLNPNL